MMAQQLVGDDQEQLGNNGKTLAQGIKKGAVSKRVKPKNRAMTNGTTERFPTSNNRQTIEGNPNQNENHVPQSSIGRGRGKTRGFASSRRGGKWVADSESAGNPPGFQGKVRRNNQKQKWETKLDGLTDLGKNRYSIPWLLERSGKESVQDSVFDLPDFLNKKSLSPNSQKRHYPFTTNPQNPLNGNEQENTLENSGDVSITNTKEQNKEGKLLSQNQQKTFQSQEHTRNPNLRNNAFPRDSREPDEKPAHHDNLFASTTTKPISTGLMAAVAEAMNVQSTHSRPALSKLEPKTQAERKEGYLYNRTGTNKTLPTSPTSRLHMPEASTPDVVPQGKSKVPHDYIFNYEHANKASRAYQGVPNELPKSLAGTYPEKAPPSRKSEPSRHSTSYLRESERALLAQMLMEKLQKYSVQPSKLSYASKTALKHIKNELRIMGYVEVPAPNLDDATLSREEKTVLNFQREIKKHYYSAIYKASKELSEMSKYKKYFSNSRKKNLRYGSGQLF